MKRFLAAALILIATAADAQWTETTSGQQAGSGIGVGGLVGATVPSAATITLTEFMTSVSGAAVISNITGLVSGRVYVVIPAAGSTWSMTTGGNIAQAVTPTALEPIVLVMHGTTVRVLPSGGTLDSRYARLNFSNTFTSGAQNFFDSGFTLRDNSDATRQLRFEVANIATATTRTITVPNADTRIATATQFITWGGLTAARTLTLPDATATIARNDAAQTFAGVQTFSSAPQFSVGHKTNGRSVNDGEPQNVTYAGGLFTGNGAMTWTVDSGDVATNAYSYHGKRMMVNLVLNTTTTGGTPNTALRYTIPDGRTAARTTTCQYQFDDNATRGTGTILITNATTYMEFYKTGFFAGVGNWGAVANTVSIWATCEFYIQ